jgi:hypothetical protein
MTKKTRHHFENAHSIFSENYTDYYSTFDLGCASALEIKGFELASLDKSNPKKVRFIFKRKKEIDSVADKYWTDKLEVKARSFFDNIKAIKNRIYTDQP